MKLELTVEQESARLAAVKSILEGKERFVLNGLAGTGKTSTMVRIIEDLVNLGLRPAVCAPTNKAAKVINSKQSFIKAQTIHKVFTRHPIAALAKLHRLWDELENEKKKEGSNFARQEELSAVVMEINKQQKNKTAKMSFVPREPEEIERIYDCIIVDESSMLGSKNTYDPYIAKVDLPKVFVGDGGQLPPVLDIPAIDFKRSDATLVNILRQKADSGILKLAHSIYHGEPLVGAKYSNEAEVTIFPSNYDTAVAHLFKEEDCQFITARNDRRRELNRKIRETRGFIVPSSEKDYPDYWPLPGEKIVIQDNFDLAQVSKGDMVKVVSVSPFLGHPNPYLAMITFTKEDDLDEIKSQWMVTADLTDMCPQPLIDNEVKEAAARTWARRVGEEVRYPYCYTAHMSQGSEWDKIVVIDPPAPREADKEWKKWWYTAVTRGRNHVYICSSHFARPGYK
jgi:exodeoxyribonuclease-5